MSFVSSCINPLWQVMMSCNVAGKLIPLAVAATERIVENSRRSRGRPVGRNIKMGLKLVVKKFLKEVLISLLQMVDKAGKLIVDGLLDNTDGGSLTRPSLYAANELEDLFIVELEVTDAPVDLCIVEAIGLRLAEIGENMWVIPSGSAGALVLEDMVRQPDMQVRVSTLFDNCEPVPWEEYREFVYGQAKVLGFDAVLDELRQRFVETGDSVDGNWPGPSSVLKLSLSTVVEEVMKLRRAIGADIEQLMGGDGDDDVDGRLPCGLDYGTMAHLASLRAAALASGSPMEMTLPPVAKSLRRRPTLPGAAAASLPATSSTSVILPPVRAADPVLPQSDPLPQ